MTTHRIMLQSTWLALGPYLCLSLWVELTRRRNINYPLLAIFFRTSSRVWKCPRSRRKGPATRVSNPLASPYSFCFNYPRLSIVFVSSLVLPVPPYACLHIRLFLCSPPSSQLYALEQRHLLQVTLLQSWSSKTVIETDRLQYPPTPLLPRPCGHRSCWPLPFITFCKKLIHSHEWWSLLYDDSDYYLLP